eukprot:TRINITY_DN9376_c0_g9_i1.p1 TRINITY_DN9376_c0_g9~~TRINITY_DN9376_c0_g9_i1.p1  ORF type:complete len:129 (-),score=5.54 TRINITY_DN9376_c0_g9_i1:330-716(-)
MSDSLPSLTISSSEQRFELPLTSAPSISPLRKLSAVKEVECLYIGALCFSLRCMLCFTDFLSTSLPMCLSLLWRIFEYCLCITPLLLPFFPLNSSLSFKSLCADSLSCFSTEGCRLLRRAGSSVLGVC